MIISTVDFNDFINRSSEGLGGFTEVIVPSKPNIDNSGNAFWKKHKPGEEIKLFSYRTVDPLKILFYSAREKAYPVESKNIKRLIVGVKACDLNGLAVLDKALLDSGFKDTAYESWRNNTTIITTDCGEINPVCHCVLLNGKPFAEKNYDLNLSPCEDDLLISAGSEKGNELLSLLKQSYKTTENNQTQIDLVEKGRDAIVKMLKEQNTKYSDYGNFEAIKLAEENFWKEEAKECIGCASCTNICPTCYCIIVNDESAREKFIKVRSYDSCQLNGYARVAGGATPRPKMNERLRNRYLCKLIFMKHDFGMPGCTGCGRCIESDPSNIDMRAVVNKASSKYGLTVSN